MRDCCGARCRLRPAQADDALKLIDTNLEDVFIYLMGTDKRQRRRRGMKSWSGFSVARWWSIVLKEFTQLSATGSPSP